MIGGLTVIVIRERYSRAESRAARSRESNMLTQKQYEQFEKVFSTYYDERDHWGDYDDCGVVTSKLKARRIALEQGQEVE